MRNILVTGGAGFIGSHTCLALLENGNTVFVIDSFDNSSPKSLQKVIKLHKTKNYNFSNELKVFEGNLCNKEFIRGVFNFAKSINKEINGVIHFAGLKSVANSIIKPISYWRVNVLSTINLLDIMAEYNCENLVFSSSATVYEQKENLLLKEDSKIGPISPYAKTKFAIEMMLKDVFESSSKCWKITSLRYFNPIGAHESGLIGEHPKGIPNNIFPLITNTALGLQKELKIYGNDWPTEDGTAVRDYIHVMDLAESHTKILDYLIPNKSTFFTLNIGTGLGTSVLKLIRTFEQINNVKVRYKFAKRREGDVPFLVADNSLLLSKFNLKPKRGIELMCKDGWKWKKLNPNGY